MKKISVIIPVHNDATHIEECVNSVINQTYKNLEIIIVDDSSQDNSIELVKKINDDRIIIIELKENVGAALARNKGIEYSKGNYICFLDADDYWYLDKIEKQVKFMEENDYTFIYAEYEYLKKDSNKCIAKVPKSLNFEQCLKNTAIFTSTVMLNMDILKKDDIYMPNLKRGQDTATWWKILKKGITAYGIQEPLSIYRVGEKSLSSNKFKAIKRTWNLYKRENINIFKRSFCFICYIINAIKRRL